MRKHGADLNFMIDKHFMLISNHALLTFFFLQIMIHLCGSIILFSDLTFQTFFCWFMKATHVSANHPMTIWFRFSIRLMFLDEQVMSLAMTATSRKTANSKGTYGNV